MFYQWVLARVTGVLYNVKWSLSNYVLSEDPDWFKNRSIAFGPTEEMTLRFFEVVTIVRSTNMLIRWEILGAILTRIWVHTSLSDNRPIQSAKASTLESESLHGFIHNDELAYGNMHWDDMDCAAVNSDADLSMEALLLETVRFHLSIEVQRGSLPGPPPPCLVIQNVTELPSTIGVRIWFMMRYGLDLLTLTRATDCEKHPSADKPAPNINHLKRMGDQLSHLWNLVSAARNTIRSRQELVMGTNMIEGGFKGLQAWSTYRKSTLLETDPPLLVERAWNFTRRLVHVSRDRWRSLLCWATSLRNMTFTSNKNSGKWFTD
jgi:hypothetical protein